MKTIKRLFASLMVAVMVLTAAPLSEFVGLELNLDWLNFNTKASAETITGTCGDNLTWSIDTETGDLVISGTGPMDYFYDCAPWYDYRFVIKTVTIGEGVTTSSSDAFNGCSGITDVYYMGDIAGWCAINFYDFGSTPMCYGGNLYINGTLLEGDLVIPNGVTNVDSYKFYNCNAITSITIPNSVTNIGSSAFDNCTSLASVTIPNSVASIGTQAFGCSPSSIDVYYMGDVAGWCAIDFAGYWSNPMSCEGNLYINGTLLEGDLVIPDGLDKVGDYVFVNCSELTSITIPGSVMTIGEAAFEYCTSLVSVVIPDSVTTIGSSAFLGCSSLVSIAIPDGVTSINDWTFYGCSNLTNITLPESVTNIGEYAFDRCSKLTSINIPESVTNIGEYAFYSCTGLTSVEIGSRVTSVGESAFSYCISLKSVTIPDSVTGIGVGAFASCSSLTKISVSESNTAYLSDEYGVLFNKDKTRLIQYPIGNSRLSYAIPDNVEIIGSGAFSGCSTLESISISASVTDFEEAFYECSNIVDVYYEGDITGWCSIVFESWPCNPMSYAENLYINGKMFEGQLLIPDGLNSIGDYSFYNCSGITSVIIPDGVTEIGNCAFLDCSSITSVTIPNTVTSIGEHAFERCDSLTSITIPDSVSSIDDDVFRSCDNLTSITIGSGITQIGYNMFGWCGSLESIVIPENVAKIGYGAFEGCYKLTKVTIPGGLTDIVNYAFNYCDELTDVYFTGTEEQWSLINIGYKNEPILDAKKHFNHIHEYTRTYIQQGTCKEEGKVAYLCECGDVSQTESVSKLDHSLTHIYIPSTCVAEGIEYDLCEYCEETFNVVTLPLSDHNIVSEVVLPTCKDDGYTYNFCTVCEYSYEDNHIESKGHSYSKITVAPTCQTGGFDQHTCTSCGHTYQDNHSDPVAHSYNVTVVEPTCENQGYTVHTCSWCCEMFNDSYIDPLGHDIISEVVEPTCETEGYTKHICQRCDYTYDDNFIDAYGHKLSHIVNPSTCVVNGTEYDLCERCEKRLNFVTLPLIDHNYDDWVIIAESTCTEEGLKQKTCSVCKDTVEEIIEPNGHSYSDTVVLPDCTEQGYTVHHCLICSDEYIDSYIDALGHDFVSEVTEPTCETGGYTKHICQRCDYTYDDNFIDAYGHSLTHIINPSTCVVNGTEYDLCERCKEKFNVVTLPLIDHNYDDWVLLIAPTCTEEGLKQKTCTVCKDTVEEKIAPNGHSYSDTVVLPNCTEQGYTVHTCTACSDSFCDSYVDPIGHSIVSEVVLPTCEDGGYTYNFCTVCGYSYEDNHVEAKGHSYSKITMTPTCQTGGFDQYTCTVCGQTYQDNYTDPVDHNYNSVVVAPTCEEQGYTVYTCTWCYESYVGSYIEALGHNLVSEIIRPTCTEQGYTVHKCQKCPHTYTDSFIAAKNHSFGEWIIDQKATIYQEGAEHRICATCGFTENETKEKVEVDPETNTDYGIANFTVVNAQSLEPIPNANIFVSTENDGENTFTTDENGKVTIPLPVGKQQISAYAEGCLTRNLRISIKPGINDVPKIGLSDLPTYEAKLTQKPMTIDEIENVGIDTSDPSNQHVYRYEVKLEFEAGIDWFSFFYFMNSEGSIIGGGTGESSGGGSGIVWVSDNNGDGGHIYIPPTPEREAMSIYPVSEYFYLIVHGEVKWLKEMYDVEMLVINNSMTDTLEDLKATLTLPDGLSLATMIGDQQSLIQNIGTIEEGGSKSVHWFVRGDKEGSYGLEALLEGMVMPFEEEIHDVFKSENQLQVLAGSAMSLHFEFPDTAYYGEDYPITITLENVSDKTIYNVSHMIQIEQGMEIYYSDGSVTQKVDESIWRGSHLLREFNPGDKIIIQTSVNIFFESEIVEQQIQQMIGFIDGMEQLYNCYKAVKAGVDLIGTLSKAMVNCVKALDDFNLDGVHYIEPKIKLFKELKAEIGSLYSKYSTTGNKTMDAILKLSNTGFDATLNMIASDPGEWLEKTSVEDIKKILSDAKALGNAISNNIQPPRKFDLFDSLRTAISALPVCFMLSNVTVTEAAGSTTSIPYSYSVTKAGPQYFGVSNVSKYIGNLAYVAVAEICETAIPGTLMLIPGFDDPFNKDEAIKYIQSTEDEIKKFKAKSATGDVTFTVWVERNSKTKSAGDNISSDFILASDNETAVYEDGVMTFTGDGTISVTPTNLNGGTLYIEDSEGNVYTYEIDVVEQHGCVAGEREVVISPTSEYEGFAVKCCETCGEILEVEILEYDDCCETHNFSEWTTEFETSCSVSGIKSRDCSVCGFHEDVFIDPNEHTCVSWEPIQSATCSQEGLEKGFCSLCNEVVYRSLGFTAHTDGTWVVEIQPTCTETGLSVQVCSVCGGNTENTKTIDPTGHNWQDWHITQNPTANQEGIMKRGCTQCDDHETMTIPALIPDYVQGIKISSDNEIMKIGDTLTLSAIIKPTSASNQSIIWTSQDSDIVSVENGVLTAHKPGNTVIVAESEDGGYKDYCQVRVIGITAVTDSVVIDHNNSLIYGIAPNLNNLDGYVQVIDNSDNLEYSSSKIGTGTSVILNNSDTEIDAYTVVLFGDVNGDGWYDGQDAVLVSCIANGMLTKEDVGEAIYMAADCNHDGIIDQLDVDLLNSAGALLANVDQSETHDILLETSSAFVDYVELIDQSADITPEDDSADISESVPEEVPMKPEMNIIDMIIGFIKWIFKSLFSVSL